MRIGEFIEANLDAIIDEWVSFARTIDAGGKMDLVALRDHAAEILRATVGDMRSAQTESDREAKGKGLAPDVGGTPLLDASDEHATNRRGWGFNVVQVVSEYRALRASVMRLWARSLPPSTSFDVDDITRFNESLDQSLAKTVQSYTQGLGQARDTFLGILGHDLRHPLSTISVSAEFLRRTGALSELNGRFVDGIVDAVLEMNGMIGDLLDFTRTRLGDGIPITRRADDLAPMADALVKQFRVAEPGRLFRLDRQGDLSGEWDAARLRQALSNLLANACRYGGAAGPITLALDGRDATTLSASVHNSGRPMAEGDVQRLFNPMARGEAAGGEDEGPTGGLGLGLFIAAEVARSHGGTIDVASTQAAGTTFTLRLPSRPTVARDASGEDRPPS